MIQIPLKEQLRIWLHVASNSFGGPAGQIAVIHKLVVEDKKLISEERFLHALNFCMLLPGPEAQQLATYMGWMMNRWVGGLLAGVLFILPGFLSILFLSYLYVIFNNVPFVQGLFYGMKPAIIAIVVAALLRISKKSLKTKFYWFCAILAFVSLFFFNISFPIVVVSAGIFGIFYGKYFLKQEKVTEFEEIQKPNFLKSVQTVVIWLLVWIFPILLTILSFGLNSNFHALNLFFSKMSLVTFGGAYAALSYVAQQAVEIYGWLQGTEMLDGLAMAETTPGPLIQTVQFVGFMGAYRFPENLSPYSAAFFGSVLSTWMTFAPCFLWIFTFAPYVEYIRSARLFSFALSAITASVVGVIFNLSVWFVLKIIFLKNEQYVRYGFNFDYPVLKSIDLYALGIAMVAFILQFGLKRKLLEILGICTILGVLVKWIPV